MRLPDPQALVKCQPFASIRNDELSTTKRTFRFYGSDNETTYTINDKTFLHQDSIQLPLDTAEEWKISAVNGDRCRAACARRTHSSAAAVKAATRL